MDSITSNLDLLNIKYIPVTLKVCPYMLSLDCRYMSVLIQKIHKSILNHDINDNR